MREDAVLEDSLPLSSTQADIWYAQQLMPDIPFTIAYYVDITGEVDVDELLDSGLQAHLEFSSSSMRVVDIEGRPAQVFTTQIHDVAQIVDLRAHPSALSSALQWIDDDCRSPLPMDGPLVRLRLFRLADDHVLWYTRAHHIALDGFASMKVLERAAAIYSASRAGTEPEPLHLSSPAALVDEDERYRTSSRFERDGRFWKTTNPDAAESIPVTLGRAVQPEPLSMTIGADTDAHRTSSAVSWSVGDRATSSVVIAAFAAFLARMTGSDEVHLSLPVSARTTALLRRAGSSVSNVVPLRLSGVGSATVDSVVKSTEVALSGVLRHQRSRPTASVSGSPLRVGQFGPTINVMMFANNITVGDLDGQIHIVTTGPVADLAVNIYPSRTATQPRIDFEANPAVYTTGDLSRYHARFLHFLDGFTEPGCGDTAVADLELFFLEETRSSPVSVGADAESSTSLIEVFDEAVRLYGDRIAVRDTEVVTYTELSTQVDRLARALIDRGVGPEDMVAVRASRSIAEVAAFWAVARVGAVYFPIDPNYPRQRAEFILRDCSARVGLCTFEHLESELGEVQWIDIGNPTEPPRSAAAVVSAEYRAHSAAYLIYTSGSTGKPKGVIVTHDGIGALTQHIRASYHLDFSSRICHLASPGFDTAVVEILAGAISGATVVIAPPGVYGGLELAELLSRESITHLLITPSALATLDSSEPNGIETIIIGGEAAQRDIVDRWSQNRRLLNAYGPTETTCSVTMTDPMHADEPIGIGTAMTGAKIYLLDRALHPVPAGTTGEIFIETRGLARGYLGRSAETATRFLANPFGSNGSRLFRSGDLARHLADGNLEFLGRTDDQIKIRGNRVELGEIDAVLRAHPEVTAASSTVRYGPDGGLRIDGYIVPIEQAVDTQQIRLDISQRLPAHMIPSTITILDAIPLTVNKKLDRAALPVPAPQIQPKVRGVEPSGATEVAIAAAYARILGADHVDVETSFFDMGGDSLAATRVLALVRADTTVEVGVRDLTDAPSVLALSALVDARFTDRGSAYSSGLERGRSDTAAYIPLAPQQRHIDRGARLPLYNLPFTIEITGSFDAQAAQAAFADLAVRHRSLRTVYPDSTWGPAQVIDRTSLLDGPVLGTTAFDADVVDAVLAEPFDVRSERPIRAQLFSVSSDRHLLACVVHHIAADGWSLGVLASDFVRAYNARAAGKTAEWTELPLEYSDFSVWAAARSTAADMEFWRKELLGAPPDIALPLDRPRPALWDFSGARVSLEFDSAVVDGLDGLGHRSRTGRFTVLRSALLVLLARLSTTTDIVIGTPVAARDDPRFEQLVGMFTNTVAIRTNIASARTFDDVLALARTSELRALDHATAPFVDVAGDLVEDPVDSLHPLFQVALSLDIFTTSKFDIDDAHFEVTPRPLYIAKCDIHVHVTERRDEAGLVTAIGVDIVYPTALFDGTTVAEFGQSYEQVVRDIIANSTAEWNRVLV
ncbi:amino acid adenylation domain-containing protein [Rhodococcus sp. H29-C3]|uniref:amino acid adenylation domain-containing protein n=1 Tax=Rhodococcus sp. H29-C3 TaxID=3046307 RepID=UPI0024B98029|nr:amino acid adenylation domain-containing protein [Rhodococcus sp. H29-C3]MDJ0361945.1 amino acid adenylation domain-containing protein [Rhodococcus sp. H29-C3]